MSHDYSQNHYGDNSKYPTKIDLCEGKYTVIYDLERGVSECLRYGNTWRNLAGDKMALAMFDRIVELDQQVSAMNFSWAGCSQQLKDVCKDLDETEQDRDELRQQLAQCEEGCRIKDEQIETLEQLGADAPTEYEMPFEDFIHRQGNDLLSRYEFGARAFRAGVASRNVEVEKLKLESFNHLWSVVDARKECDELREQVTLLREVLDWVKRISPLHVVTVIKRALAIAEPNKQEYRGVHVAKEQGK
jgi:hypothetical protein